MNKFFKLVCYLFSKSSYVDGYARFQIIISLSFVCYLSLYDVENSLVCEAGDDAASLALT